MMPEKTLLPPRREIVNGLQSFPPDLQTKKKKRKVEKEVGGEGKTGLSHEKMVPQPQNSKTNGKGFGKKVSGGGENKDFPSTSYPPIKKVSGQEASHRFDRTLKKGGRDLEKKGGKMVKALQGIPRLGKHKKLSEGSKDQDAYGVGGRE